MDDFSKQKIIWGEISDKPKFTLDKNGRYFLSNKAFLLSGEHLHYLLAFLNSRLCEYFFSQIATTTGVGTVQWLKYKAETLPVPCIDLNIEKSFIKAVDYIIELKSNGSDISTIDNKLNNMIYNIFSLNSEEIKYIENHTSKAQICSTSEKSSLYRLKIRLFTYDVNSSACLYNLLFV